VSDRQQQIDVYMDSWNTVDVRQRHALIQLAWSEDGAYHAPSVEALGHGAISANIARVQRRYPNRVFCRTSEVFQHKDRVRYTWAVLDPGGAPTIAGVEYALFGADGRLRRVTSVCERTPAAGE